MTSTDSGLAVPDWPLSYGMWFPPMVGGILYEHGHRMIAAAVGFMILVLAVWLWRLESRGWVRRLGYSALAAVTLQGLLGGLTVLLLLPPQVSIAHASLGQAVFCLVVCLARALSPSWTDPAIGPRPSAVGRMVEQKPSGGRDVAPIGAGVQAPRAVPVGLHVPHRHSDAGGHVLRPLSVALAGLAGVQLLLGALLRHTGYGLSWHIGGAVLLVFGSATLLVRTHRAAAPFSVRQGARRLGGLVGLQVGLGLLALAAREPVGLVTAHVGLGALVLAQTVLLAWDAQRLTRSRRVAGYVPAVPEQAAA